MPDFSPLNEAKRELRTALERADGALAALREAVKAVELAASQLQRDTGSTAGNTKRQALFYWAIFLEGGTPESGDFVEIEDIDRRLKTLGLVKARAREEGRAFTSSALNGEYQNARDVHYEIREGAYRLLPAAVAVMDQHKEALTGLQDT